MVNSRWIDCWIARRGNVKPNCRPPEQVFLKFVQMAVGPCHGPHHRQESLALRRVKPSPQTLGNGDDIRRLVVAPLGGLDQGADRFGPKAKPLDQEPGQPILLARGDSAIDSRHMQEKHCGSDLAIIVVEPGIRPDQCPGEPFEVVKHSLIQL
jgi:hypothetical protein